LKHAIFALNGFVTLCNEEDIESCPDPFQKCVSINLTANYSLISS